MAERSPTGERVVERQRAAVDQVQQEPHAMWEGIDDFSRFYFVHSYCVVDLPENQVAGRCEYGLRFAAANALRRLEPANFLACRWALSMMSAAKETLSLEFCCCCKAV